jgi:hypothetical protein
VPGPADRKHNLRAEPTLPGATNDYGRAINISYEPSTGEASDASLVRSVLERNQDSGIFAVGAALDMEHSVVRDTLPRALDGTFGYGISLQPNDDILVGSAADIRTSVIERNIDIGILALGTAVSLSRTIVRDTRYGLHEFGRGVHAQVDLEVLLPTTAIVDASVVTRSGDAAILVYGATLTLTNSELSDSIPQPGVLPFGDGLAILAVNGPAVADVSDALIRNNARAGVSVFSSSLTLRDTRMECNAFDLDAESLTTPPTVVDAGGNVCGCNGAAEACKAVSTGIGPPDSL